MHSIYEIDKTCAAICRDMTIAGMGWDSVRAGAIAIALQEKEIAAREAADTACGRPIAKTETGGFKSKDLEAAFFKDLQAPIYFRSGLTGRPSLGVDALRGYAASQSAELRALSLAVLEWRRLRKVRRTYIEGIRIGKDGRVHPTWQNYGAVSGRWSAQKPNPMNLPRAENDPALALGGIRSLYIPVRGGRIVTFDFKQLEFGVSAYCSGDPTMIRVFESGDVHAANAQAIFGAAFDPAARKALNGRKERGEILSPAEAAALVTYNKLRTIAKSAGFAVAYSAEAQTVYVRIMATGVEVTLPQIQAVLRKLHAAFSIYFEWQAKRLLEAIASGYTDEQITGRTRYVTHDPSAPEVANFAIQGGAAGIMNSRIPLLLAAIARHKIPATLIAQVHDSGVFDVQSPQAAEDLAALIPGVMSAPLVIGARECTFPVDLEVSEKWH